MIGNYVIERKTPSDLIGIKDGSMRVYSQIERLKLQRDNVGIKPIIFVDKVPKSMGKRYRKKVNVLMGTINSILFEHNIPVVLLHSHDDIIFWTLNLIKRAQQQEPNKDRLMITRTKPKNLTSLKDEALFVLQGFEGIGEVRAKKITENYNCLNEFLWEITAENENKDGIPSQIKKHIREVLNKEW